MEQLLAHVRGVDYYSLCFDSCTGGNNKSYLGLVVYVITKENKLIKGMLSLIELGKSHTSESIRDLILSRLVSNHLDPTRIIGITTDAGANMIKASTDYANCRFDVSQSLVT
jgi:hypothetical protein